MATKTFVLDMSKLEPLDGKNYKRWSQRILFYLDQIEVDYVLFNKIVPIDEPSLTNYNTKFDKDNKTCRGMMLHYMTNVVFDIYVKCPTAKEIWDALAKKYGSDDAGSK